METNWIRRGILDGSDDNKLEPNTNNYVVGTILPDSVDSTENDVFIFSSIVEIVSESKLGVALPQKMNLSLKRDR